MQTETFSLDELLATLEGARIQNDTAPAGVMLNELAAATGRSKNSLAKDLRILTDTGKVVPVRVPYVRIDGQRTMVSAYRLVRHD